MPRRFTPSLDELGSGGLQGTLHFVDRAGCNLAQPVSGFQSADRDDRDLGTARQFLLVHTEQGAGGTDLVGRDQHDSYHIMPLIQLQAAIGTTCPPGT